MNKLTNKEIEELRGAYPKIKFDFKTKTMTRQELKEKIEKEISPDFGGLIAATPSIDTIMNLIDEYTKPKTKTLEERKDDFTWKCVEFIGEYPDELVCEFKDYWTEHNEGGKKMRFEMSKNQPFNIKRRLATWKKNQKNYGTTTTKKGISDTDLEQWVNS